MNSKERVIRTLKFDHPDSIPVDSWVMPDALMKYGKPLTETINRYAADFFTPDMTDHVVGAERIRKGTYTDGWGCIWENLKDGIVGEVKSHPLADYSMIRNYRSPKELLDLGWENVEQSIIRNDDRFIMTSWAVNIFERMQFLRGTQELLIDLCEDSEEVRLLRDIVFDFNIEWLKRWLRYDIDGVIFNDDWGTQNAMLVSPAIFRKFFKPLYRELISMCKDKGKFVFFHSDGNIHEIMDDFVEMGVDAINCQTWLMGIESISAKYKGKITFWGEIDRQTALPFGNVQDIRDQAVRMKNLLTHKDGGVIGLSSAGDDSPLENIIESLKCWNITT